MGIRDPEFTRSYKLSELDLFISQVSPQGIDHPPGLPGEIFQFFYAISLSCKATHEAEEAFSADIFDFYGREGLYRVC